MYLAMDQIANHAANWHYMFGGQLSVPITIWGIINRGGEQSAQHSQALQAIFAHIPGLKVVMPSSPHSAKGLLAASVMDDNPVVYIDDRWLYEIKGEVPADLYHTPIGRASVIKRGKDVTIVSSSYMTVIALKAAKQLDKMGISAEIVDLLSVKPLDGQTILASVSKTGRAVILDGGWRSFGISAEISATISEKVMSNLKAPVIRMALPDAPAPASAPLEKAYYPDEKTVIAAIKKMMKKDVRNAL
jgi:pyruvate dehydrogenase E1 component beta subunit